MAVTLSMHQRFNDELRWFSVTPSRLHSRPSSVKLHELKWIWYWIWKFRSGSVNVIPDWTWLPVSGRIDCILRLFVTRIQVLWHLCPYFEGCFRAPCQHTYIWSPCRTHTPKRDPCRAHIHGRPQEFFLWGAIFVEGNISVGEQSEFFCIGWT